MSIFSHHSDRSSTKRGSRGFTLLELLVVMSIMMLLTVFMLVKQSRFDSSTVLRALAYSVALSVRQAQVYGTSVVGTSTSLAVCAGGSYNTSTGNCYASAYGLYFNTATPSSYTLFADLNNDGRFNTTETVKVFNLGNGYVISNFCATNQVATDRCEPSAISTLTIIFKRPNPDATFVALDSGGAVIPGDTYGSAYIQIQAIADAVNTKRITVLTTGEVTVCTSVGC